MNNFEENIVHTQQLGQETMSEQNDTQYINETEMEMEQQEKEIRFSNKCYHMTVDLKKIIEDKQIKVIIGENSKYVNDTKPENAGISYSLGLEGIIVTNAMFRARYQYVSLNNQLLDREVTLDDMVVQNVQEQENHAIGSRVYLTFDETLNIKEENPKRDIADPKTKTPISLEKIKGLILKNTKTGEVKYDRESIVRYAITKTKIEDILNKLEKTDRPYMNIEGWVKTDFSFKEYVKRYYEEMQKEPSTLEIKNGKYELTEIDANELLKIVEQDKNKNIARKFTFNISEQDRRNIRNMLSEKIYEKSPYTDNTKVNIGNKLKYAQTTLYYNIGMLDYDMAFKNTNMIDYLHKRADYSSMLQVVEEEMVQLGISTSNKLQINKNIEGEIPGLTKKQNEPHFDNSIAKDRITVKVNGDKELTIPSEVFHGTNEKFLKENIGKKDADGKYYVRDGVLYWSFEENTAKRYGNNILKHKFDKNGKFICINDTDGGIALRCQEDLYKQSKSGTKYVICSNPHRSDVMDISNYADFVDTRDEKLAEKLIGLGELTKPFYDKNVSYSEYMEELEKARETEKDKEER